MHKQYNMIEPIDGEDREIEYDEDTQIWYLFGIESNYCYDHFKSWNDVPRKYKT